MSRAAAQPESAAKGKQSTSAKAAKKAKDANPGETVRGHADDSEPHEDDEDEAEREARKMREAAEKVTRLPPLCISLSSSALNFWTHACTASVRVMIAAGEPGD